MLLDVKDAIQWLAAKLVASDSLVFFWFTLLVTGCRQITEL